MRRAHAALPLVFALVACSDAADEAAKARIFSPEEPALVLRRAAEQLAADKLATDPALLARVMTMDRLEAARRLGAHKAVTSAWFKWQREGRTVALSERHELTVDGEGAFRALSTNDHDTGLEVVYAGGRAYAKNRYGPFRLRRMDRAQQDAWRDRATPAMATLWELAGDRLGLKAMGEARKSGRSALRYQLELVDARPGSASARALPPVQFPARKDADGKVAPPGPDADTQHRLDFLQARRVEALSGELFVDATSGAVLALKAKARFIVGDSPAASSDLDLSFEATTDPEIHIAAPANVAEARLAHAVNDPLGFLGDGKQAAEKDETAEAGEDDDAAR